MEPKRVHNTRKRPGTVELYTPEQVYSADIQRELTPLPHPRTPQSQMFVPCTPPVGDPAPGNSPPASSRQVPPPHAIDADPDHQLQVPPPPANDAGPRSLQAYKLRWVEPFAKALGLSRRPQLQLVPVEANSQAASPLSRIFLEHRTGRERASFHAGLNYDPSRAAFPNLYQRIADGQASFRESLSSEALHILYQQAMHAGNSA